MTGKSAKQGARSKTGRRLAAAAADGGAARDAPAALADVADECAVAGAIVGQISDIVLLLDAAGRVVYANQAVERTFGHATAAIQGWPVGRLVPALEALDAEGIATAVIEAEPHLVDSSHGAGFDGLTPDGEPVPLKARAAWLEVGGAPHLLLTLRDIRGRVRVREELQQLRTHMAQIVEGASEAIISADSELRIVLFNRGAEQIFGYAAEEVLGRHLDVLLPKRFRDRHSAHIAEFAASDQSTRLMGERALITGLRKTGDEFPAETSIMKFDRGGRTVFTAVLRDVTKRHAAEAALRASERRYRSVFESAVEGMYRGTPDGSFLEINPALARMLGYESVEAFMVERPTAGTHLYADPADREAVTGIVQAEGEVMGFECEAKCADGSRIWIAESARAVRDTDGTLLGYEGFIVDVSERHRTETALRKSQTRLADAQRIAQLGNWEWDLVSGELHWSDEIYHIFGLEYDRFGATYEAFLERVHPEDRPMVREAVDAALEQGVRYAIDHRIVRPDGTERIVHEHAEVQYDAGGRPVIMAGTVQDITARKEHEQALALAKDEAETASRAKSQFLATMSHELRTPLNAIIGFAEILEGEVFGTLGSERYRDYSRHIRESGQHLLSIVNDVLDVAKVEAGRVRLHEEVIDVARLASAALRLVREQSTQAHVGLEQAVPPGLPGLRGDERLLKQMLTNLLSNAVKFTGPEGAVTVGAAVHESGELEISVADTGIGIAPEQLEAVLDPFVQGDNSLTRRHAGTGLGLPLVHAFVHLHGGTLHLDSEVDAGTVARLMFPARRVVASPALERTGTVE